MYHSDIVAEQKLLALALSGHRDATEKFARLPHEVFTRGVHQAVAEVLRDTINRGERVHPPKIALEAAQRADTANKAEMVQRFVTEAASVAPPLDSFDFYARETAQQMHLRKATGLGERLMQAITTEDLDLSARTHAIRTIADDLEATSGVLRTEPPISLQELLDEPDDPYDWLVPGLLERMDRLVITAFEGVGKSELLAQFGAAIAAGIHPFAAEPMRRDGGGYRVLVLDCENPRRKVKRRYRRMREAVEVIREQNGLPPVDWSQQLRLDPYPAGVDLTDAREQMRLEERIAAAAPDLVVAGPLYKMHNRDMNEEPAARELVAALDQLRVRYRFTLIAEAHSPHGDNGSGKRKLRPAGSSLFLRWPEFGYGLRGFGDAAHEEHPSIVELVPWRGAREERHWPELLKHGGYGELAWVPANASYWRGNLRMVN